MGVELNSQLEHAELQLVITGSQRIGKRAAAVWSKPNWLDLVLGQENIVQQHLRGIVGPHL